MTRYFEKKFKIWIYLIRRFELFEFTYPIATPVKNLVWFSIICNCVGVTSRDASHSDVECRIYLQRYVLRTCSSKSSLVVAAPCVHNTSVCEGNRVHTTTHDLDDWSCWKSGSNVKYSWFSRLLDFQWSVVTQAFKNKINNASYTWNENLECIEYGQSGVRVQSGGKLLT